MAEFTIYDRNTSRDITFTSNHTDSQVYEKLADVRGNFAASLRQDFAKYRRFTDRQRSWAHKLVHDHENPAGMKLVGAFPEIYKHIQRCAESRANGGTGLLRPIIELATTVAAVTLKLTTKGKHTGKVTVANGDQFYGRMLPNGQIESLSGVPQDVLELLGRVEFDPPTVISQIGREMGTCCYCRAELSQVQSKIAGCGATCARNWSVWYPNAAETRTYVAQHPEVLTGASDADRWSDSAPVPAPAPKAWDITFSSN